MTLPLIANNATNQAWWGITNQAIGVLNQLTDGTLLVNGALVFTNTQFSIAAAAINVANSLVVTSPSGNSFTLQSSNAVVNGTMFITGAPNRANSLYVSNDASFSGNVWITGGLSAGNLTVVNVEHTNTLYANGPAVSLYSANISQFTGNIIATGANSYFTNIISPSVSFNAISGPNFAVTTNQTISNVATVVSNTLSVTAGVNITGGATINGGETVDTLTVTGLLAATGANYSLNVTNNLYSTGTVYINSSKQLSLINGSYGVQLINDGSFGSLRQTAQNNQFGSPTSFLPFSWNLNDQASVFINNSPSSVTYVGGQLLCNATVQMSGAQLNVLANTQFNALGFSSLNTVTVSGNSTFSGTLNAFQGNTTFAKTITAQQATFGGGGNQFGNTAFNSPVTHTQPTNWTGAFNSPVANTSITAAGEIQGTGLGAGNLGGQFRAIFGNYGTIFRNDGNAFYILGTNSVTNPASASYNGFRPFSFSLATGTVSIAADGSNTLFGGNLVAPAYFLGPNGGTGFISSGGADMEVSVTNGLVAISGGRNVTIGNYGFLVNTGAATSAPAGTFATGLYVVNCVMGTAFLAFSDERVKTNIETISPQKGVEFVRKMRPISYQYKDTGAKGIGFSAQEQVKAGFNEGISFIDDDKIEETIDEDGFLSPKGKKFVRSYDFDNAYFVAFGKYVLDKLEKIEARLDKLEKQNDMA